MVNKSQDTKYSIVGTASNENEKHSSQSYKMCLFISIVTGTLSLVVALLCINFNFFEMVMQDRIKMRPGSLPMEMWRNPPVWVAVEIHLFAVINSEEFLAGNDKKLKIEDIGPIYYRNYAKPIDIVLEKNSTLSYTSTHNLVFDDDLNEPGILNKSIIVPNSMLLGMASYLYDRSGFVKFAFNMMASKDEVFLNRTVYEVLWNFTSPILQSTQNIPFVTVPSNAGVLYNTFYPTIIRYNVQIGSKNGFKNFFKINTLNGNEWLPAYTNNSPSYCPFWLKGTNDITNFPILLKKTTPLAISSHNLCRTFPLQFNREINIDNIDAYEFILRDDTFTRLNDSNIDCLKETNGLILPNGVVDAAKCALDMPVGVSAPHFLGFEGEWNDYLDGLKPNNEKHLSVIIVEPKTGGVLVAKISLQTNLLLPTLSSRFFSEDMMKFNNMVLPLYWLEYRLEMDSQLRFLIKIISKYLPMLQLILIVLFLSLSCFCLLKVLFTCIKNREEVFKRFKSKKITTQIHTRKA